jgi:Ulp1 protease family, C-terminal catalytic domain
MHRAQKDPEIRQRRYEDTLGLRRLLPTILVLTSFYESRLDLRPLGREWDLRFAHPEHCFEQKSNHSCGPFSLMTMHVLMSRRLNLNVDEDHMKDIRLFIADRIFTHSLIPAEKQ